MFVAPGICLSVRLSVRLAICLSGHLFLCLCVGLSVYLFKKFVHWHIASINEGDTPLNGQRWHSLTAWALTVQHPSVAMASVQDMQGRVSGWRPAVCLHLSVCACVCLCKQHLVSHAV